MSGSNLTIQSLVSDKDLIFAGNDGGSGITALTLDMSSSGAATFNSSVTIGGGLIIPDGGDIGSASDLNAMQISSSGVISITATTANTNASDGALTVAGGVGIAADLSVGDDLRLISDGAILNFGADSDITLTHNADTGLTLNGKLVATELDISGDIDVDGTTNLDVVDIDGAVDMASTLGVGGVLTANAGVVVDNITIDGTEIDLSSGNLTIDVAGAILLDADVGNVQIHDAGTEIGRFANSSSDFVIKSAISDQDMIFKGNDGGSEITALTFDMSDGGAATFAKGITLTNGNVAVANGNGIDFSATADNTAQSSSMASELLDDYEEGTWTPSFSVTTTAGDLGYHSRQGSYIKIGNQVTVWFYINAYENNASGDFRVNVPFTSQNVSNYFAVASLTKTGWPSVTGDIEGRISANATIINLVIVNNANESANVTQANTDPNFYLYGTITYKTA